MVDKFEISKPILVGESSDASLIRTIDILRVEGINPRVTIEVIANESGVLSGMTEASQLLSRILPEAHREGVWALNDGDVFEKNELILQIRSTFATVAPFITALTGIISSSSGWATGARKCVDAANGIPIVNFGTRNAHPNIVGNMDYSSVQGGAKGCSSLIGSRLTDLTPAGSMDENLVLILGDVVEAAKSLIENGEENIPKVVSIGILGDESEEAKKVVENFPNIRGLKIETPNERGGSNHHLLREIRERLDQLGFSNTQLSISGDFTPNNISDIIEIESEWLADVSKSRNVITNIEEDDDVQDRTLNRRLVQAIGVNRFIACHSSIDIGAYLKEIDGNPVSKRGKIPGVSANGRLTKLSF